MQASKSAPALGESPYAASVGPKQPRRKKWVPPPGAFNEPDLPARFANPGPGRYNPAPQNACLSTKPRVVGCRFGSEDRYKYFGPQTPLERTSSGMLGGLYQPQSEASPGPGYMPSYNLVRSASRSSSFTVERREGTSERRARGGAPGPGLYNPSDKASSTVRNYTAGGNFLGDDRHRYLGEVDPASLTPSVSDSPGPMYMPSDGYARARAPTVAFGGKGPGSMKKPPSLKAETPGPGAYTPATQAACLSTKRRAATAVFGIEQRGGRNPVDSTHCFHGKVSQTVLTSAAAAQPPCERCNSRGGALSVAGARGHAQRLHGEPLARADLPALAEGYPRHIEVRRHWDVAPLLVDSLPGAAPLQYWATTRAEPTWRRARDRACAHSHL